MSEVSGGRSGGDSCTGIREQQASSEKSYWVYVLYSRSHGRFYKGHTENLLARLSEHNQGKVKTTMAFRPWEVVHREEYRSREDAIRRERYLKTGAGRRYLARVLARLHEE